MVYKITKKRFYVLNRNDESTHAEHFPTTDPWEIHHTIPPSNHNILNTILLFNSPMYNFVVTLLLYYNMISRRRGHYAGMNTIPG